jgi:hypothetical protein
MSADVEDDQSRAFLAEKAGPVDRPELIEDDLSLLALEFAGYWCS